MAVKSDVRYVNSKRDKTKKVKKTTYKCEGSYVDMDGVPHRYHKRGFSSAEEAKEWERTFLLKATNKISGDITFGELYSIYKENKLIGLKKQSFYDTDRLVNVHILPYWKNIKLSAITSMTISTWQKELLNKTYSKEKKNIEYSNNYLDIIQTRFKTIIKYGITLNYIKDIKLERFEKIIRKDVIKKEMLFWQPDEFMLFIKEIDENLSLSTFFHTLYWCGLRLGEALALTWNDIDQTNKIIKVRKTYAKHNKIISAPKTENSLRDIIIPDICFNKLMQLYKVHVKIIGYTADRFVFGFEKPIDENTIRRAKNKACASANIKQIRIHDFRHSHVSLLINQGFSAFDIAKRLGHSVEMVNNVYGHWFTDAQQNMVNRLNEISKKLV